MRIPVLQRLLPRGGAQMFVAPILLIAIFGSSILFTYITLSPHDKLSALVPNNIVAYIHYRAIPGSDTKASYAVLGVPRGLSPKEIAIYAQKNKKMELSWTTLLSWDNEKHLPKHERTIIASMAGTKISDGIYKIGSGSLALNNDTIANNHNRSFTLKTLQSIAPIQIIIKNDILFAKEINILPKEDLAIGMTVHNNRIRAHYTTVTSLIKNTSLFGYASPLSKNTITEQPPQAPILLFQKTPKFDPFPLLFPALDKATTAYGTPKSDALLRSEKSLRQALNRLQSLRIFPNTTKGSYGFIMRISGNIDTITKGIANYLSAALPQIKRSKTPDGGKITEFIWNKEDIFEKKSYGVSLNPLPGVIPFIIVNEDNTNEVILSESIETLKKYRNLKEKPRESQVPCTLPSGNTQLIIQSPLAVFGTLALPGNPLSRLKIHSISVNETVDNSGYFCGLIGVNVDNHK